MPQESDSYLVIAPDKPTPEEMAQGAKLIPSMLDEGVMVWRVYKPGFINHLGESVRECAIKLCRQSGGMTGARVVAWKQLCYYRRINNEDMTSFYGRVLDVFSPLL